MTYQRPPLNRSRGLSPRPGPAGHADYPRHTNTQTSMTIPEEEASGVFRQSISIAGRRLDMIARRPEGGSWTAWVAHSYVLEGAAAGDRGRGRTLEDLVQDTIGTGATGAGALEALVGIIETRLGLTSPPEPTS